MKTTYRFRGQQGFSTDPLTGLVFRGNLGYYSPLGRRLSSTDDNYSAGAWKEDPIVGTDPTPGVHKDPRIRYDEDGCYQISVLPGIGTIKVRVSCPRVGIGRPNTCFYWVENAPVWAELARGACRWDSRKTRILLPQVGKILSLPGINCGLPIGTRGCLRCAKWFAPSQWCHRVCFNTFGTRRRHARPRVIYDLTRIVQRIGVPIPARPGGLHKADCDVNPPKGSLRNICPIGMKSEDVKVAPFDSDSP